MLTQYILLKYRLILIATDENYLEVTKTLDDLKPCNTMLPKLIHTFTFNVAFVAKFLTKIMSAVYCAFVGVQPMSM